MYFIATLTTLVYIICLIMLIRFAFSRTFLYWIFPLIISAALLVGQVESLIVSVGGTVPEQLRIQLPIGLFSDIARTRLAFPLLFSILFMCMIITFHHAVDARRPPVSRRKKMMMKNYAAVQYVQMMENNAIRTADLRHSMASHYRCTVPHGDRYPKSWENLYD
ncbi:MAG: hypothetical protein LKE40_03185 [Spirochaetia bacterium]|jgi:hypothetical protein|nr:hypothetical protein [Spirochaetia bacterium]